MGSSFHDFTKKFDPIGHASVEAVHGIDKRKKQNEAAVAKAQSVADKRKADEDAALERMKVTQVATRQQNIDKRAAAAGAMRSGNDQDVIRGGNTPARRKYASKVLLGE